MKLCKAAKGKSEFHVFIADVYAENSSCELSTAARLCLNWLVA